MIYYSLYSIGFLYPLFKYSNIYLWFVHECIHDSLIIGLVSWCLYMYWSWYFRTMATTESAKIFVICKYEYVLSPVGTWHQINQSPDTHRSKRNDGCWEASGSDPHPPKLIVNSGGEINRWYITFNHHCLDIWMVVTYYLDLYFKPFYVLGWSTKWFWTCVNQVSPYMNSEWSCAT